MEPPEIAVEVLGGDAAPPAQEALDLAVAAVDRLDVQRAPDPLAGRGVDALVRDVERRRDGRIAAVGVGNEQRIWSEDRLQHFLHAVRVQRRQGMAEGLVTTVGGDQDRHLLAREAALAGLVGRPRIVKGESRRDRPARGTWRRRLGGEAEFARRKGW